MTEIGIHTYIYNVLRFMYYYYCSTSKIIHHFNHVQSYTIHHKLICSYIRHGPQKKQCHQLIKHLLPNHKCTCSRHRHIGKKKLSQFTELNNAPLQLPDNIQVYNGMYQACMKKFTTTYHTVQLLMMTIYHVNNINILLIIV